MCSMWKGGRFPTTVIISKRTGRSMANFRTYASVEATMLLILRLTTASYGCPKQASLRVLTSTMTSAPSFCATMSRSRCPECQFRCLISYPFSSSHFTAAFSPSFPSSLCDAIFPLFRKNTHFYASILTEYANFAPKMVNSGK